jgi:hypothetical protein
MAGRFSFSVPGRRSASDPWFRIGTLDVNTTVLVVLMCVASMFVWALDPGLVDNLVLYPDLVRSGEIWRVFTWPVANAPSIWTAITVAIFWYFGREIEGLLGRTRFAWFLAILTVVPGIIGVLLDLPQAGIRPIEFGVFLVFIAEYPFIRFFFGVPGWAIGAIFLGIEVLQLLGLREYKELAFLFLTLATAAVVARSMGLLQSVPWVPKVPVPHGRRRRPRSRGAPSGTGRVVEGPWTRTPAPPTALPQPPSGPSMSDQAELDNLLDKISANGMDGLTADEKRRLNELSKRLRNRK